MTIQIYVGTYSKYNSGSIAGAWVDLEGHTKESFYEACKELHSDEVDPEFMFQDYEGFPSSYYGESGLDAQLWDWLDLSDDDKEVVSAFIDCFGSGNSIEQALDAYCGEFDSDEDQAWDYIDSTGMFSGIPESITNYFDIEKFARDCQQDVTSSNNRYFYTNW